MIIAVKCKKCDWVGNAEVGRRKGGLPLNEQRCPRCGSEIQRRLGRYIWGDELAKGLEKSQSLQEQTAEQDFNRPHFEK